MTTRSVNFLVLLVIPLFGVFYLMRSYHIATESLAGRSYEPLHFPVALGAVLLILCAVEVGREIRNRTTEFDAPFEILNVGKLVAAIGLIAFYFAAWKITRQFYPVTAVFIFALILIFRGRLERKVALAALVLAIAFTLAIYLVFEVMFGMRLI